MDAPRLVIVPETLMTGRRPIDVRISSDIVFSKSSLAEDDCLLASTAMP
jgi:hypothetical protein